MEHFFLGFILEPSGQLKSFANSGIFENDPMIRNSSGLCGSELISERRTSSVYFAHQKLAALNQNICSDVRLNPANIFSGLFLASQLLNARYAILMPPVSAMFSFSVSILSS